MDKIKAIELFGGLGAGTYGLKRQFGKENVEIVDYVELDKHAVKSYNTINGTNFVPTDINDIDMGAYPEVDVIIAGWPCQDYSVAGKGLGLEGTRSNLILLTISKIKEMTNRPKHILLENVKGLLSKKHIDDLDYIKELFDELGYNWNQAMLNSKYFGVPQARERVFMILTRKDLPMKTIDHLEQRNTINTKIKDILENNVEYSEIDIYKMIENKNVIVKDDKFWYKLSDNSLRQCFKIKDTGTVNIPAFNNYTNNVFSLPEYISTTLMAGSTRYIALNFLEYSNFYNHPRATDGLLQNGFHNRVWKDDKVSGTILASAVPKTGHIKDLKLKYRQFTSKETWRLMGFSDEAHDKCKEMGVSKSQLTKQAGNSIVVNVLEAIFEELFKGEQ